MAAIIFLIVSILLSCTIPTEAQGDVAISSLVCKLDGMEITLNEDYMTVTFPTWKDYGLGLFVDDALPSCGQMAPLTFLGLELGPYTGFLNFSTCNINITKNHVGQELVNYTAVVNGRFNALNNYITSPTANFHYPNMTVTLYCVWNAEQFANASIGIVPTPQPTYYGSTTDTNQVVMNTTVDSEVFEGEKIRVGIILTHIDAFTFVAELPMECTISNADNSADAKLYTVYESCPFWNISQFNPSLNFDAYKKNSSDFYFEFDAFTYYEGQPSTLLIQCKVQMCLYAVDCPSSCWPESNETTFLTAKSRLSEVRQSSTLPSTQVSCVVHVLPRTLTTTSPPQTPYPQLSSTQSTSAIYKNNLTALYIVLGVVLVTALVLCVVLSICFTRPRRSHSDNKQIFRDPYRLT